MSDAMNTETLFKVENLKKVFEIRSEFGERKRISAVDGVNLEIYKGETLGIVGESGCGKTTLGKLIIRLIEPTEGKIYYRNIDITNLREKELRRLRKKFQIIFQDPYKSLNPRIRVGYSILEGMDRKLRNEEKAKELLEIVGISREKFYNFPHQFSGGERQRISIARALSTDPEFIVCDEPTSNLDLSIQAQILNLFMELKEKFSLTYLFISHDLKVIEFVSDRIAVMYNGKIVEIGPAERIIREPSHPYTKSLIKSAFK